MENPVPLINKKNETFLTDADLFRPSKTPNDKLNKTPAIKKAKLLSKISDKGNIGVFSIVFFKNILFRNCL